jgi:hypothetical protein
MERKVGRLPARAFSKASSPQGYQSTGLCALRQWYLAEGFVSRILLPLCTMPWNWKVQPSAISPRQELVSSLHCGTNPARRYCAASQSFSFCSKTSSGMEPPSRITAWKTLMSNLSFNFSFALARIRRIVISPNL